MITLIIESTKDVELVVENNSISLELDAHNDIPSNVYEKYEGDYVVTPQRGRGTVLETTDKLMTDNVTVKEIPYSVTTNLAGGNTCYIGKEVL